jgi:hypothetical protein
MATIREWLTFDHEAGWGTPEFEKNKPDDYAFPERWRSADDRYDARDIHHDNEALLAEANAARLKVLQNGYQPIMSANWRCAFSTPATSSSYDCGGGAGCCCPIVSMNVSFHTPMPSMHSIANSHASSRAVFDFGCGCSSSLSVGNARSTRIVVACSRSYASRNCCFGDGIAIAACAEVVLMVTCR